MDSLSEQMRAALEASADIQVAFVFGSLARGEENPASDLDIGVAAHKPLSAARKLELMDALAVAFGRPIDLVDLRTAPVPVLHQALTTGICILKEDKGLYAELLRKLWYDRADIMPNYELILQARRRRFVDE